jgi:hypothetical protein
VIVRLGSVSTVFRDATPGSFTSLGSLNISSQLSHFGSGWADTTTLWIGAVDNIGTSATLNVLTSGDPQRTIYATKARTSIGTVGQAGSSLTIASGSANGVSSSVESIYTAISGNASPATSVTFTSAGAVANGNPVNISGIQQTAYSGIASGVQSNFQSGNLGTYGSVANVELALDLFRVQFKNNIAGQYGNGAALQTGQYLGTITVDNNGAVGFTAVPEPSTYALLAMAAGVIGFVVRRRSTQKSA